MGVLLISKSLLIFYKEESTRVSILSSAFKKLVCESVQFMVFVLKIFL